MPEAGPVVIELVVGVVVTLLLVWAALVAVLWWRRPEEGRLRAAVRLLPAVVRLVGRLARDPAVPLRYRLGLLGLAIWLVSPIDLVPEFLPVVGPLDDAIVALLVLGWVVRGVPAEHLAAAWPGDPAGLEALRRLLGPERTS